MSHIVRIDVAWDTQDPGNHGWAWYAYRHNAHHGVDELDDSGPLNGRASCGDKTLAVRARRAAGVPGTRTPVRVTR